MDGEVLARGRPHGRATMERLVSAIEANPDQQLVRISMAGIEMLDGSFASEAIVELIRRYMGKKGICLVDFEDSEGIFNLDLAARNVGVPVAIWDGKKIGRASCRERVCQYV